MLGEQEQPVPPMVSPKATGAESEGQDHVAKVFEVIPKSPPRPGSIDPGAGRVLSEHKPRAKDVNNAEELSAERRRSRSASNPRPAVLLAGVAPNEDVAAPVVDRAGREGPDVVVSSNSRPAALENGSRIGVDLHLECGLAAGLLQP